MQTTLESPRATNLRQTSLKNIAGFMRRYRNWREVLRKFRNNEPVDRIHLWNGLEFKAKNTTEALLLMIYNEVWHCDVYRIAKRTSPFLIGRFDTVVDLGANIGLFTIRAAKLARRGLVLAVEPDPDNYSLLTTHLHQAGIDNVVTDKVAVGKHAGTGRLLRVTFGTHTMAEDSWSGADQLDNTDESLEVPCVPLAELLDRHQIDQVDLLKMDIEGSEWDVMESTPPALWSRIRRVVLEYHDVIHPKSAEFISGRLNELGYRVSRDPRGEQHGVGLLFAHRT
jgi:FkbM family methyltransferase